MGGEGHRSGRKGYTKRQIFMLAFFFQKLRIIHNPLYLYHIFISIGYQEYHHIFNQLSKLTT